MQYIYTYAVHTTYIHMRYTYTHAVHIHTCSKHTHMLGKCTHAVHMELVVHENNVFTKIVASSLVEKKWYPLKKPSARKSSPLFLAAKVGIPIKKAFGKKSSPLSWTPKVEISEMFSPLQLFAPKKKWYQQEKVAPNNLSWYVMTWTHPPSGPDLNLS